MTGLKNLQFDDDKITAGALVTMSGLADHPACQQNAPAIYGSLWQAASPQIRNMATLGR
ncbi:Nicotinate dehydrogenase FAD-subunit [Pantoea agglomerans]|uniref:Nicotinate dehydrogenase FAD-subunit n=1 Tax=Enterobacter agglomerans TaxID=549 RepID=A0A379LTL5_ENTAG|nr:Nicotinate dehydrogenase FAD-subunit [Pantoea agglomerans]